MSLIKAPIDLGCYDKPSRTADQQPMLSSTSLTPSCSSCLRACAYSGQWVRLSCPSEVCERYPDDGWASIAPRLGAASGPCSLSCQRGAHHPRCIARHSHTAKFRACCMPQISDWTKHTGLECKSRATPRPLRQIAPPLRFFSSQARMGINCSVL